MPGSVPCAHSHRQNLIGIALSFWAAPWLIGVLVSGTAIAQRLPPTQSSPSIANQASARQLDNQFRRPIRLPSLPINDETHVDVLAERRPIARIRPELNLSRRQIEPNHLSNVMTHGVGARIQAHASPPLPIQSLSTGIPKAPSTASCPPVSYNDFSPTPIPQDSLYHDPMREAWVYDAKADVPTQHPWVEWGRIFYGNGITPRGKNWFGATNLARPQFYVYGDFRTGIGTGRNAAGRADNWASRLNLDMDLKLTDTERFHAFMGPLDNGQQFTRVELIDDDLRYEPEFDANLITGYFEGDVGAMLAGWNGTRSPFELPITVGLVPLLFQNGVWMEDAVTGAAIAIPAQHSRALNWSNYDWTFFAIADQLNSPAFGRDEHAAQALGTACFIDAYGGYIEAGYAYLHDRKFSRRSYHNMTFSFTRRYFHRISNSVRVIINAGQDLPSDERTADGGLLLVENSWITPDPLRFVPYANFFFGWDRPQSVARAGVAGGILRNTGINFDTDGLNGLATLDPTASDTAGGSIGVDLIGRDLDRQWLVEMSYLAPHGNKNAAVPDDQYGLGTRYQFPISNATLLRFDFVYGWRRGLEDVYGTRMEYRWKF